MPCILKPTPLWSGKQILSYLLPQKLSYKMYQNRDFSNLDDRSGLFIRKGEIISGALQRHHVGPGSGALIHAIWM
jgi:DNA-directed RNA polymerase II subunit RPB1